MTGNDTPGIRVDRETDTEYFLRVPKGFTREPSDNHSDVSLQMFRHEKQIRESQWRGGENFFDGKHDDFCFVCGGTMELFECQTCENCYHAECMTPAPEQNTVPSFWFCPHCVDRDWHIPSTPSPSTYFTPISPPLPAPLHPSAANITRVTRHSAEAGPQPESVLSVTRHRGGSNKDPEGNQREVATGNTGKPIGKEQSTTASFSVPDSHEQSWTSRRPKRSSSPPRKKSKYSAFSTEVDKALSVIHSELEKAGQDGKSEGKLRDKIQDLELRLRIQDGQMQLTTRELALSRKNLTAEHCHSERLQSENTQYKEEVMKLREALEKKDSELREWRAKLRSMMGNDLG